MKDLIDLIFDPNISDFCVAPSTSFEEMEDLISDDKDDDSKEIKDISLGHVEPMPKFENLEDSIMQDGESIKENETDVNK